MRLTVELLDKKKHDRAAFDCGLTAVNEFLHKQANRQMTQKINRIWVLLEFESSGSLPIPIIGYFTLTSATVVRDELPAGESRSRFPGYPMPVIKLAWFGIASSFQRNELHLGETLLLEALDQAYALSQHSGLGVAVVTDPLTERSEHFFKKYGFRPMDRKFRQRQALYLPMGTVARFIA